MAGVAKKAPQPLTKTPDTGSLAAISAGRGLLRQAAYNLPDSTKVSTRALPPTM
jgi:hypothetical protein